MNHQYFRLHCSVRHSEKKPNTLQDKDRGGEDGAAESLHDRLSHWRKPGAVAGPGSAQILQTLQQYLAKKFSLRPPTTTGTI